MTRNKPADRRIRGEPIDVRKAVDFMLWLANTPEPTPAAVEAAWPANLPRPTWRVLAESETHDGWYYAQLRGRVLAWLATAALGKQPSDDAIVAGVNFVTAHARPSLLFYRDGTKPRIDWTIAELSPASLVGYAILHAFNDDTLRRRLCFCHFEDCALPYFFDDRPRGGVHRNYCSPEHSSRARMRAYRKGLRRKK